MIHGLKNWHDSQKRQLHIFARMTVIYDHHDCRFRSRRCCRCRCRCCPSSSSSFSSSVSTRKVQYIHILIHCLGTIIYGAFRYNPIKIAFRYILFQCRNPTAPELSCTDRRNISHIPVTTAPGQIRKLYRPGCRWDAGSHGVEHFSRQLQLEALEPLEAQHIPSGYLT